MNETTIKTTGLTNSSASCHAYSAQYRYNKMPYLVSLLNYLCTLYAW